MLVLILHFPFHHAQALNWELRPVTVYDCIRGFCSLLVETSRAGGSTSSSLALKEEKEKQVDQLRLLAEEIADLSLDGEFLFVTNPFCSFLHFVFFRGFNLRLTRYYIMFIFCQL